MDKKKLLVLVAGTATLLVGLACGSAGSGDTKPLSNPTDASQPAGQATSQAPAPKFSPSPADFVVTIKVIKKQCFGSAGCLVTYRTGLTYKGPQDLADDSSYEISYEIKGAEDPIIGTITTTGMKFETSDEETASTKSSTAKLTARVTGVEDVG